MAKAQSPLLGFNNNVRHRGRVFHIQTEDSGIKYPHVITHLFADGGRILKSIKTSYAESIGSEDLENTVRTLMKEQHKSMFIALRDGQFDDELDESSSNKPKTQAKVETAEESKPPVESKPTVEPTVESKPTVEPPVESKPRIEPKVDLDVLERAAAAAQNRSPLLGGDDMPPPPASVLAPKRPSGSYRAFETKSSTPRSESHTDKEAVGRYSGTRPASIFGASGPSESSGSVFGEELISGKSLDEVILSFLSEEFGAPPEEDGGKEGE